MDAKHNLNTDNIISSILVEGKHRFYRVTNDSGKTWILPAQGMRTAMSLYQPGGVNGRRLKRFFPLLHAVPGVRQLLHAQVFHVKLRDDLSEIISNAFGVPDFDWALFGGTPSVHQKITMQISRGNEILGYVKLSDHPVIKALFDHERHVLAAVGHLNVPKVLSPLDAALRDGIYYFIQTTRKTKGSREVHVWTDDHNQFVEQLFDSTVKEVKFEDSDYYRVLCGIDPYLHLLSDEQQSVIKEGISYVKKLYSGKVLKWGVAHSDFTPWNMVVNPDGLFVFDWEYANLTYPPGLDRWHYIIQTSIFERVKTHDEIIDMVSPYFSDLSLLLYTLDMICRFTAREKGRFPHCMGRSLQLWCRILEKCLNTLK